MLPLSVGLFLLAGCAGGKQSRGDLEKTPITTPELPDIEQARGSIVYGSPDSISRGYQLLRNSPAGNSPEGEELIYAAENLMRLLYPRVSFELSISIAPGDSLYPAILEDVKKGEFTVLIEDWNSPLPLNVASCAALFSDDSQVLILCEIAAKAVLQSEIERGSVVPYYIRGIIEKKRGNFEAALSLLKEAYDEDPSVYSAKWEAAKLLRVLNKHETALPLLEDLTERFPEDIDFLMELSSCCLDMGMVEKALNTINRIDITENEEQYDEFLLKKSEIQEAAGDINAAVETIEELKKRNPEDLEVLKRLGMLILRQDKIEKGITVLELAAEKGLEDLEVYKRLLAYYNEQQLWSEAKTITDKVYEELDDIRFIAVAANVYRQVGEHEKARVLAKRLVDKEPENAGYLAVYAQTLVSLNEFEEAENVLRSALSYSGSRQQRSELFYLLSLTVEGKDARAEMLQNALFENMENVDALMAISYLYRKSGEYKKAYRYIKQAAALAPDNRDVMNLYAEMEGLLGD